MMDEVSLNNAAYWIRYPLDQSDLVTLRRIQAGLSIPCRRFEVAYLIARECVKADYDNSTLIVTPKGDDALQFFEEVKHAE